MGQIVIRERKDSKCMLRKKKPKRAGSIMSSQRRVKWDAMEIFFRDDAVRSICEIIEWGERTLFNMKEQGGIMVGNFCDAADENEEPVVWAEICDVIPCRNPEVSYSDFLEMSFENWKDMFLEMDRRNRENQTNYVLIGWYHTHPGRLTTFFSETDRETQRSRFTYPYSVGAVFNPHRMAWTVYYGPECKEGKGYLLLSDADEEEENMQEERGIKEWDFMKMR